MKPTIAEIDGEKLRPRVKRKGQAENDRTKICPGCGRTVIPDIPWLFFCRPCWLSLPKPKKMDIFWIVDDRDRAMAVTRASRWLRNRHLFTRG